LRAFENMTEKYKTYRKNNKLSRKWMRLTLSGDNGKNTCVFINRIYDSGSVTNGRYEGREYAWYMDIDPSAKSPKLLDSSSIFIGKYDEVTVPELNARYAFFIHTHHSRLHGIEINPPSAKDMIVFAIHAIEEVTQTFIVLDAVAGVIVVKLSDEFLDRVRNENHDDLIFEINVELDSLVICDPPSENKFSIAKLRKCLHKKGIYLEIYSWKKLLPKKKKGEQKYLKIARLQVAAMKEQRSSFS
jgi:hypothetical protein